MDIEKLKKANELHSKINQLKSALNCFERQITDERGKKLGEPISLNPKLIIEFDDDDNGREQRAIPMKLSDVLTGMIKQQIKNNIETTQAEFDSL